jgi:hypothetical protein
VWVLGIGLGPTTFGLFSVADLGATDDDGNVGRVIYHYLTAKDLRKEALALLEVLGGQRHMIVPESVDLRRVGGWFLQLAVDEGWKRNHVVTSSAVADAKPQSGFPFWAEHLELVPRGIAEIH